MTKNQEEFLPICHAALAMTKYQEEFLPICHAALAMAKYQEEFLAMLMTLWTGEHCYNLIYYILSSQSYRGLTAGAKKIRILNYALLDKQ